MKMRKYRAQESPEIGDVFQLCDGPYGSAIITEMHEDHVICERIHASTGLLGQIQIGVERVKVSDESMREKMIFTTGPSGRIDNRLRD